MNRRSLLKTAALASLPAPAVAMAAQTPKERVEAAIEELKAALLVYHPNITSWTISDWDTHDYGGSPFVLAAYNTPVKRRQA